MLVSSPGFKIKLRFYEELNDFLPQEKRKQEFEVSFKQRRSVKDLIESLGVPHTEVDLIIANSKSVDFSYILKDGDRVSVYPVFEAIDIRGAKHLKQSLRQTKFVADVPLRKLARYLRLFGFDTTHSKNYDSKDLVRISVDEKRILLTRSPKLLKFKEITHAIFIREDVPQKQLEEVFRRVDLYDSIKPLTRCIDCNTKFKSISKKEIKERVPPGVRSWCNSYKICNICDKIYWEGSHVSHMSKLIDKIKERNLDD